MLYEANDENNFAFDTLNATRFLPMYTLQCNIISKVFFFMYTYVYMCIARHKNVVN